MPIPDEFIEALNRDADIVAVIGRHVKLTKKGSSHVGLCPFHKEKTPSFNVVPAKGFYHCFGCGASGTALGFLMRMVHGNDFLAAVADLAAMLGREVPRTGGSPSRPRRPSELLERMARFYQERLFADERARQYLKERGLDKDTALRFRLGYAPRDGGLQEAFDEEQPTEELQRHGLLRAGEGGRSDWAYFRDRVIFPIEDSGGRVAGFGGRVLGDAEPKYLNSPQSEFFDKGRIVYGLRQATDGAREMGRMIVVEGYMDVVMLARHGVHGAVATMGTAATESQLRAILTRTDEAVFCFDGDDAGKRAQTKAAANVMPVLKDGKAVRFALLPAGEDPDSIVRARGKEGFFELIAAARSLEDTLLAPELEEGEDDSAAALSERWQRIADLIERLDRGRAGFLYEVLYKRLHEASGIEIAALKEAARKRATPPAKSYVPAPGPWHSDMPLPPEPPMDIMPAAHVPANAKTGRRASSRGISERSVATFFACIALQPALVDKLAEQPPLLLLEDAERDAYFQDRIKAASQAYPDLDRQGCLELFKDDEAFQALMNKEMKRIAASKEQYPQLFRQQLDRFSRAAAAKARRQKELAAVDISQK
ncbi:MAG: DNA primase [Betaproteobacteria bacterium AqS2]|uniref:DNA primase n=1 Tax=Candidatus Amphirhobacter heronislandensis TaxID=1732024 RepID=A0A930UDH6_9GAMM|nr:DNA primase [Betaproteobacteria bacterium AqS2]